MNLRLNWRGTILGHPSACAFRRVRALSRADRRTHDSQWSRAAIHQGAFVALMRAWIIQLEGLSPPFPRSTLHVGSLLPRRGARPSTTLVWGPLTLATLKSRSFLYVHTRLLMRIFFRLATNSRKWWNASGKTVNKPKNKIK